MSIDSLMVEAHLARLMLDASLRMSKRMNRVQQDRIVRAAKSHYDKAMLSLVRLHDKELV